MTGQTPTKLPKPALPEPLRGNKPDSFPQRTISERLPSIAQRVLREIDWPAQTRVRLESLISEMPHGRLRPLQDPEAPDSAAWGRSLAPYVDQTWLDPPWFLVETYFFRRILEATGYYQPGPGQGIDPYNPQKLQELASVYEGMGSMCTQLDSLREISHADQQQTLIKFIHLLRVNIWGNQTDLSMWPSGSSEGPDRPQDDRLRDQLLVDQAPKTARYLGSLDKGKVRVDFILDNVGMELAYDLDLADFLLTSHLAHSVRLHAKPHPTYVSDATIPDVFDMVECLEASPEACISTLAFRLRGHLANDRLHLTQDYFWTSPLSGWQMPATLYRELSGADLIISKGDANYRRWLGDRHWPHTTPLEDILVYRPAPLLALRVLKANLIAGLASGQSEDMDQKDPHWLYNGQWGVIQFVP